MAIFQNKDGELRIVDHGTGGVTHYVEVLFTDGNLSAPVARPRTEEILYTDRGNIDVNSGYRESPSATRLEPMPLTFTCRQANTRFTEALTSWLSGATRVRNKLLYTRQGQKHPKHQVTVPQVGVTLPTFADSGKRAYIVEARWNISGTSTLGFRWDHVYFPPNEQTVTEAEDAISLNLNGRIYGGVTAMTSFTTATDISSA